MAAMFEGTLGHHQGITITLPCYDITRKTSTPFHCSNHRCIVSSTTPPQQWMIMITPKPETSPIDKQVDKLQLKTIYWKPVTNVRKPPSDNA